MVLVKDILIDVLQFASRYDLDNCTLDSKQLCYTIADKFSQSPLRKLKSPRISRISRRNVMVVMGLASAEQSPTFAQKPLYEGEFRMGFATFLQRLAGSYIETVSLDFSDYLDSMTVGYWNLFNEAAALSVMKALEFECIDFRPLPAAELTRLSGLSFVSLRFSQCAFNGNQVNRALLTSLSGGNRIVILPDLKPADTQFYELTGDDIIELCIRQNDAASTAAVSRYVISFSSMAIG
ncbi:hypothetical protein AAVH_31002, partial [Aphelenchoides avenae]